MATAAHQQLRAWAAAPGSDSVAASTGGAQPRAASAAPLRPLARSGRGWRAAPIACRASACCPRSRGSGSLTHPASAPNCRAAVGPVQMFPSPSPRRCLWENPQKVPAERLEALQVPVRGRTTQTHASVVGTSLALEVGQIRLPSWRPLHLYSGLAWNSTECRCSARPRASILANSVPLPAPAKGRHRVPRRCHQDDASMSGHQGHGLSVVAALKTFHFSSKPSRREDLRTARRRGHP